MQTFEDMVDEVVDGGLTESAVISNYFLVNYPYLQHVHQGEPVGAFARIHLDQKFSEEKPQQFIRITQGDN